jgi:hypothetical protein
MGKDTNKKMWAMILVVAMITATFVGFTAIGWGPSEKAADVKTMSSEAGFSAQLPFNMNALNSEPLSFKDNILSPPPENEIEGLFTYDFDSDTVDQWPADPPWAYGDTPPGSVEAFGPDDFEDDVPGNNPDLPPWRTTDGMSITEYWTEDFEGFSAGQDLTGGQIGGSQGYFGNFVGGSTLVAETPPAGAPPGTIIPGYTTGNMCANFTDPAGGSYWGPAGIGDTVTTGYAGGWVYMNTVARFDILLYDLAAGATMVEVALQNDNLIYHWPCRTTTSYTTGQAAHTPTSRDRHMQSVSGTRCMSSTTKAQTRTLYGGTASSTQQAPP